jgi:hypothetical protein
MSRRKKPAAATPAASVAEPAERRGAAPSGRAIRRRLTLDFAILIAVFAVTVGIAELAGAANLGVALGIGQVAFAIALVLLLLRE